jgi:His/Glu/Gln/Arg/opine family amino acid ABC transporter permease subunit
MTEQLATAPTSGSTLPIPAAARWHGPATIALQLAGVLLFVLLLPFAFRMEWDNFVPIFEPSTLQFLAYGVAATVIVSLVSILLSLPMATGLALGRLSKARYISWPCIAFIEVIRALPLILLIFYINLRFPGLDMFKGVKVGDGNDYLGIEIARILERPALAVVVALTLYTAAVNAELLRSGILSLERGQTEAARSLGLTYWQTMRLVILPQAFRRTLAPLIAQFTILVKDTSLGSIIGFVELQKRGVIIYQQSFNSMETLYVIALIYFVINYLLGLTSRFIERKRPSVEVRVEM